MRTRMGIALVEASRGINTVTAIEVRRCAQRRYARAQVQVRSKFKSKSKSKSNKATLADK